MSKAADNATSSARRRTLATPAWLRRLRYSFSREKLREFITTMGLVVPLTALIWIWAEREQTLERDVQVTVDVRSRNPNAVVSLARADDKIGPVSVSVKLSGPKVGIDALLAALSSDATRGRVMLEVPDDVGADGTRDVAILPLLDQQNLFRDFGITVRSAEPDTVKVRADAVVTQDLRPTLPADIATRVESIETEPASIRVRGSALVIERLKREGKLRAELDVSAYPNLRESEPGKPVVLPNLTVRPIDASGVTLETLVVSKATLKFAQVREGELRSVVVEVGQPAGLNYKYDATPKILPGVRIVGPPDLLRQLALAELNPPANRESLPYASLRLRRDDLGKTFKRTPLLMNLPPGVRAVEGAMPEVTVVVDPTPDEAR